MSAMDSILLPLDRDVPLGGSASMDPKSNNCVVKCPLFQEVSPGESFLTAAINSM